MKITIKNVKKLFKEAMGDAPKSSTVELTEDPKAAAAAWPETTWHGKKVIDYVYGLVESEVEPQLFIDREEHQEVYLGYLDLDDCFVVGFDAWSAGDEGEMYGIAQVFRIDESDRVELLDDPMRSEPGTGFYYKGSGQKNCYSIVQDECPGIVDLRLD